MNINMKIDVDVNVNIRNIEAIVERISKVIDLNRVFSIGDKAQSVKLSDTTSLIEIEAKDSKEEIISEDDLRYLLAELSRSGKAEEAKNILGKYNCTKVPQLKEADYNQVHKELSLALKLN